MRKPNPAGCLASAAVALAVFQTLAFPVCAQQSHEQVGDSLFAHFENVGALEAYSEALARSESFEIMFKSAVTANEIAQDLEAAGDRAAAERTYRAAVALAERLRDIYPDEAGSWFVMAATAGKLAQFSGGKSKVAIGRAVEG